MKGKAVRVNSGQTTSNVGIAIGSRGAGIGAALGRRVCVVESGVIGHWLVISGLLIAALLLGACSGGNTGTELEAAQKTPLADFPAGVGRGYPAAQLIAGNNSDLVLQPGRPAPDFALVLDDGRHLLLSDLRGRPVVLNFWATWCGPCRLEMPELMQAAAVDPGLVMLAMNVQEAQETVAPFADEFAMTTPVVLDPAGAIKTLYAVRGLPTTVFIDPAGQIQVIHPGLLTPTALEEHLATIR